MRVCIAINEEKTIKLVRFSDNMRELAVTEGNKVSTQIKFDYAVNTHAVGDLVSVINSITDDEVAQLIDEYETLYKISSVAQVNGKKRKNLIDTARIELGIQRLMAKGYGFAGEGDWKTAALLRTVKVMAKDLSGGTAFMEDYTYDFTKDNELVIGSHMLEVCPSIIDDGVKPTLDIQPLGIGDKADSARLIFSSKPGAAINASLINIDNRFRLVFNAIETVKPYLLPKLLIACTVWKPKPSLNVSAEAWVLAGATHHYVYTQALSMDYYRHYAQLHNIELLDTN